MPEPLIICDNLVKIHKLDDLEVMALQGLDLTVQQREVMALVGASGSGKTTLLNVLGGLDRPTAGRATVGSFDLLKLSNRALDRYRRQTVGFVWQQKARNLIPYLNAEQNVMLPMIMNGVSRPDRRAWASELVEAVGLAPRRRHRLAQLSGGEQQRVAIAVALANRPALLLADEPTGELDSTTAETIFEIFHQLNRAYGLTVVIVSHDPNISHYVERVVTIRDGKTSSETLRRAGAPLELLGGAAATGVGSPDNAAAFEFEELMMLDSAGRLQLPKELREKHGITRRILLEETPDGLLLRPVDEQRGELVKPLVVPDAPPPPKPSALARAANLFRRRT